MLTTETKDLAEIKVIIADLLTAPINQGVTVGIVDPVDYQNIKGLENLADPVNSSHVYFVGKLNDEIVSISAASKFIDPTTQRVKILHRLNYVRPDLLNKNIGSYLLKQKAEYFQTNNWNEDEYTIHFAYTLIDNEEDFFSILKWDLYTVNDHANQVYLGYKARWEQYKTILDSVIEIV
jgi:hypothetical protein